jgi:hypothetical protein
VISKILIGQGTCAKSVQDDDETAFATQGLSPDLSGTATLVSIISAGRREEDGLTFGSA